VRVEARWFWSPGSAESSSGNLACLAVPSYLQIPLCGGLTLAGYQVLIKATLSLPSSVRHGRKYMTKGLWVEIKTGRDHSPSTFTGKTVSTWGN